MALLPPDDAKQVLLALFSAPGDVPEMTPLANMAYTAVKGKSDRISARKSSAGKMGGAPAMNQNARKQAETTKTTKTTKTSETSETSKKQAETTKTTKTTKTTTPAEKQPKQPTVSDTVSDTVPVSVTVEDNTAAAADARVGAHEGKNEDFEKIMSRYAKTISADPPEKVSAGILGYLAHMSPDVVSEAIERAAAENRRTWSYVDGILRKWKAAGVADMADVSGDDALWESSKAGKHGKTKASGDGNAPGSDKFGKPDADEIKRLEKTLEMARKGGEYG